MARKVARKAIACGGRERRGARLRRAAGLCAELQALNIHKADIYTLLKDMCNEGFLIAEGHGRGTRYYLPILDTNIGSNIGSNVGSNVGSNLAYDD